MYTISAYFILSGISIVLLPYIEMCELNPSHDSTSLPRIPFRQNHTWNVIMGGGDNFYLSPLDGLEQLIGSAVIDFLMCRSFHNF
jgi:hypothetical protein